MRKMSRTCCGKAESGTETGDNSKRVPLPKVAQALRLASVGPGRPTMADFQDPGQSQTTFHPCHQEERRRMAEMKRKKLIRKLEKNYQISVDGFNERVTDEIIKKVESIERENREREKRQKGKAVYILTKLLEEQRSKRKGNSTSFGSRKTRSKIKRISPRLSEVSSASEVFPTAEEENGTKVPKPESRTIESPPCERRSQSQESVTGEEDVNVNAEGDVFQEGEFSSRTRTSCTSVKSIPLEKSLEALPKRVIFKDYKSGQVYFQSLKITNVSLETIHCRYLGIVVDAKRKEKGRFPIAVAVRDSVKLRPGLSCSTKIRLSSKEEAKELECSIVYETRRQRKPLKHSFFFVPVSCVPARAIVRVFPLKIRFPSVTWCAARGPNSDQLLRKSVRIENSGGKECYCRIVKKEPDEGSEEGGVGGMEEQQVEEEDEESNSFLISNKIDVGVEKEYSTPCEGEEKGEISLTPAVEAFDVAEDLLEELIDNVFDTFRFSEKYHIVVPPFSTKQIDVRFIPEYKGFHQEVRLLLFEDCHNCREETLELTGDIKKLPLVPEPRIIDLKTCVTNSGVYSATFTVYNASKGPYSVRLRLPNALKRHAHVHPKGTILQPLSSSEFSVRLYPRLSLGRDMGQYYNQDSAVLEFPIFIHPAGSSPSSRSDSVKVYVFAVITDYSLEISPPRIDFGHVTTLETVRASVSLTNRSLSVQDFAFLNLPKDIRVEPNMGFGTLLPMETVSLFLLYSPSVDVLQNGSNRHTFDVKVTTLAECGGFGEKLPDEGPESSESVSGEFHEYGHLDKTPFSTEETSPATPEQVYSRFGEQEDDFGECYDSDFAFEDDHEWETKTVREEETKIRNYLRLDGGVQSDHSFFKRINLKGSNLREPSSTGREEDDDDDDESLQREFSRRFSDIEPHNVIRCVAAVTEPSCQLSESVIQLPSTPCSSFSLYRFRLKGSNGCVSSDCTCFSRRNNPKTSVVPPFEAAFEFKWCCPQIKLEPRTGFIKAGEIVPITVIYRPEFPAEDICRESRNLKAKKLAGENSMRETPGASQPKARKSGQGKRNSAEVVNVSEIINASLLELEKYDLFAGERSLQELIGPFHVEAKVDCLVRVVHEDGREVTEIHRLVLVCPAVKPRFVYKGTSQEIDFDKVFVGTKSRRFIEVQNISFGRIRPVVSLLNPVGPFLCLSSLRNTPLDPEHILRLPLVYSPSNNGGPEKEYFEIHCGSTNISLVAKGEAVVPEYRFTPNYACCLLESKIGSAEEFRMDVENLNPIKLKLSLVVAYGKEGLDVVADSFRGSEVPKDNPPDAASTDKKKKTESQKKYLTGWEETPEHVLKDLERYEKVAEEVWSQMFSVAGTDDSGQILVPPLGKTTLKIKFTPPPLKYDKGEPSPPKRYAVNYRILLDDSVLLKEILVLGSVSRSK